MGEHESGEQGVCPRCERRSLLRAVVDEVRGVLAGELSREPAQFRICPVCGWNDLPDRQGGQDR